MTRIERLLMYGIGMNYSTHLSNIFLKNKKNLVKIHLLVILKLKLNQHIICNLSS